MALSLSLRQEIGIKQKTILAQFQLSTIGTVPLFSLHKIRKIWSKSSPKISDELSRLFFRFLFERNEKYKKEIGKDWNCITLDGLHLAISDTKDSINEAMDLAYSGNQPLAIPRVDIEELRNQQINLIKKWFNDNYEKLIYSLNSKLPWVFIMYLKTKLQDWVNGMEFAFDQDISEIAKEFGLETDE